ncbi:11746_t:CDS:2, partial [Diversispora eburnea]
MQVTEGFYKRINQIRRELLSISREVQVVLDKTGIHLIAEGKTVNLVEPAISTRIMREDDSLLPYVMDAVTAVEEEYDLTEAVPGHDATGLLSIATNLNNSSGQQMNVYRKLGEYIYNTQQELTATALKQELEEYSQRNGTQTHTIALRARWRTEVVVVPSRLCATNWVKYK